MFSGLTPVVAEFSGGKDQTGGVPALIAARTRMLFRLMHMFGFLHISQGAIAGGFATTITCTSAELGKPYCAGITYLLHTDIA